MERSFKFRSNNTKISSKHKVTMENFEFKKRLFFPDLKKKYFDAEKFFKQF